MLRVRIYPLYPDRLGWMGGMHLLRVGGTKLELTGYTMRISLLYSYRTLYHNTFVAGVRQTDPAELSVQS